MGYGDWRLTQIRCAMLVRPNRKYAWASLRGCICLIFDKAISCQKAAVDFCERCFAALPQ